jgi:hypothetical protein
MGKKRNAVERETVSRERIRQIQMRALGKMRRILLEKGYKFEDFFDDSKGEADGRRQARTQIEEDEN